jgi:hypothetical protein
MVQDGLTTLGGKPSHGITGKCSENQRLGYTVTPQPIGTMDPTRVLPGNEQTF